jgi:hypothetical protein
MELRGGTWQLFAALEVQIQCGLSYGVYSAKDILSEILQMLGQ